MNAISMQGRRPLHLALASRGDPLTPYLFDALERRYCVAGRVATDLTRPQRAMVAVATVHPSKRRWAERFYKSHLGYALRSANAHRQCRSLGVHWDVVFQVHTLFEVRDAPSVLYVDCTHRQSAEQWPAWNPLSGEALRRWYARERHEYRRAVHVFSFSHATRASLIEHYGVAPERVTVVGAGANDNGRHARSRVHGGATILFVGNDFVRKGGDVLVAAFARVKAAVPEARLQLVGASPDIAPHPGVDVLGRIHDRARMARLYSEATVFCLPSHYDPYPLVLLEAMSHGLPTVTSTSVGIPEMVVGGSTGELVCAGDVDAVARSLTGLLLDPTRAAAMGNAGRERIASHFTWDAVVGRMAPVLDALGRRPIATSA